MSLSTATNLVFLDSAARPGTITLPLTTTIPGRTLTLKDVTGAAAASTITIVTSGSDTFEDGTTTKTITTAFGTLAVTGNAGKWYTTATSQPTALTVSTLSTTTLAVNSTIAKAIIASTATISSLTAGVLTASTIQAPTVSSLIALTSSLQANSISSISIQASTLQGSSVSSVTLWASTINGFPVGAAFTGSTTYLSAATTNIQQALISSISANTATVVVLSTMAFNVSSINGLLPTGSGSTNFLSAAVSLMSSVTIANVAATQGYISSLVVDSFQIGSNAAFINMGDVIATSLSTIQLNTGILYTNSTLLGNTSNQTAIQFYGLQGGYNNTVLAEQSTSATTQEFVVFRGSSVNDRIRMQTTGNIVFETGVSSRLWPNAASNATPALMINTLSNVGIQTASPAFPLDVAGTARSQTLSSFALYVSSINNMTPAGLFLGSSIYLSSAQASLGLQVNISSIANFSSGSIAFFSTASISSQFTITDTQLSTVSTTLSQILTKPTYQAASTLTYSYTGGYQYLIMSTSWTHLFVQMWGAGGGGSNGGGGAYVQGYLPVTQNESLTLIVGYAGQYSPGWTPPSDAQGGGGGCQDAGYTGGGRSAIKRNTYDVVTAGGGGAQTYSGGTGGAATWSGTAWSGNNQARQTTVNSGSNAGGGGQTGPGISAIAAWSGSKGFGGYSATNYNGGGGGGWYGGGASASQGAGAGGGSSYTDFLLAPTGFDAAISTSAYYASPMRINNAGQGGYGNGLIYITPYTAVNNYKLFAFGTTLMPTMTSIDNVGAVRIWRDTIDPNWALDVGARSRFQYLEAATMSTLTINTSNINVSSILGATGNFTNLSTNSVQVSSISLGNVAGSTVALYQQSTILYYGANPYAGVKVGVSQFFTVKPPPLYYQVTPSDWSSYWSSYFQQYIAANSGISGYVWSTSAITGSPTTNGAYIGGVLAPNGKIYCIPYNATSVGVIDPTAGTFTTFGTAGSGGAYYGGVLAPNGKIYCIPFNATAVGVIDPVAGTFVTNTVSGAAPGSSAYNGGVLAPNGKIYCFPHRATTIGVIDPTANTFVTNTVTITNGTADNYYIGGVLAPNGNIYVAHGSSGSWNSPVIDTTANTFNTTTVTGTSPTYGSGGIVLLPTGKILATSSAGVSTSLIDPVANTITLYNGNGYSGAGPYLSYAALAPNGFAISMYNNVAYTNPTTFAVTAITAVNQNYYSGLVMHPNGNMYAIPTGNAIPVGVISFTGLVQAPSLQWCLSAYANKL